MTQKKNDDLTYNDIWRNTHPTDAAAIDIIKKRMIELGFRRLNKLEDWKLTSILHLLTKAAKVDSINPLSYAHTLDLALLLLEAQTVEDLTRAKNEEIKRSMKKLEEMFHR